MGDALGQLLAAKSRYFEKWPQTETSAGNAELQLGSRLLAPHGNLAVFLSPRPPNRVKRV
jgi:hypothetical protein